MLGSRRRVVVLVTIAVLLALDLGRSLYARLGYAQPTELWQPPPEAYAALAWPPGSDLSPSTPPGRRLYVRWCAVCHGPDGRGNGPAAPSLIPRPRDLARGLFKYKSTAGDHVPTDDDLIRVVANGLPASAMPSFRDLLSDGEVREVVAYVKTLSPAFAAPVPPQVTTPPRVPPDAASLARGRALYADLGCDGCHGADGRLRETYSDAKGHAIVTRDLTAPWTFRGGRDPGQLWLRLGTMSSLSPMPSYAEVTSPTERWDVVNYVLSLARVPAWEPGYLYTVASCALCHGSGGAGGAKLSWRPLGTVWSRNLTPDRETGLGAWTDAEIARAIRSGIARDGRIMHWQAMIWDHASNWDEEDVRAIIAFLRALPPVQRALPAPRPPAPDDCEVYTFWVEPSAAPGCR